MKQTYMPCLDCSYGLQARHPDLEGLWLWLTNGMTLDDPYVIIAGDLGSCYETLEEMRFIVTHEVESDFYLVKVLGFREGSQLICVHRHMS